MQGEERKLIARRCLRLVCKFIPPSVPPSLPSKEDVPLPAECAIKVFKTTLNEFKNRDRYIKDDYRFKDRFSKQNPRKVVRLWAEKEMHNLKRLNEGGISCPEVVFLRKHILIMSFIGHDQKPAPTLKEIRLPSELMRSAYEQCIHVRNSSYISTATLTRT